MPCLSSSLLSRLRRHLRVVALLFVGLMVLKTGFAATCAADSFANLAPAAISAADTHAAADGRATPAAEATADSCWHAGAGGCHCACVHVTPLQPQALAVYPLAAASLRFSVVPAAIRVAPRDDHLRPPIA